MANNRILRGLVYDKTTQVRYSKATLRLDPKEGIKASPIFAHSDLHGVFKLDLSNEKKYPDGDYLLSAFHQEALMETDPQEVTLPLEEGKTFNKVALLGRDQFSQYWGVIFGIILVSLLLVVSFYYAKLHFDYPIPLDEELQSMVSLLTDELDVLDQARDSIAKTSLIPNSLGMMDTLARRALVEEKLDSTDFGFNLTFLLREARRAANESDKNEVRLLLREVDELISKKPQSFFWETYPWRFLEIVMWALIATFLRLIVNTGYYLFRKRFIKTGVFHSLGLIFTVPILALLISIVLSFIKINFSFGEAEFNLDLTNIYTSILVATFIGLSPWKGWDYLNGLAESLFKRLNTKKK